MARMMFEGLQNFRGSSFGKIKWSFQDGQEVQRLRTRLEAHKSTLDISLDLFAGIIASSIKKDTTSIKEDNEEIKATTTATKEDTTAIKRELEQLREQIKRLTGQSENPVILERFLNGSLDYAETVVESSEHLQDEPYQSYQAARSDSESNSDSNTMVQSQDIDEEHYDEGNMYPWTARGSEEHMHRRPFDQTDWSGTRKPSSTENLEETFRSQQSRTESDRSEEALKYPHEISHQRWFMCVKCREHNDRKRLVPICTGGRRGCQLAIPFIGRTTDPYGSALSQTDRGPGHRTSELVIAIEKYDLSRCRGLLEQGHTSLQDTELTLCC